MSVIVRAGHHPDLFDSFPLRDDQLHRVQLRADTPEEWTGLLCREQSGWKHLGVVLRIDWVSRVEHYRWCGRGGRSLDHVVGLARCCDDGRRIYAYTRSDVFDSNGALTADEGSDQAHRTSIRTCSRFAGRWRRLRCGRWGWRRFPTRAAPDGLVRPRLSATPLAASPTAFCPLPRSATRPSTTTPIRTCRCCSPPAQACDDDDRQPGHLASRPRDCPIHGVSLSPVTTGEAVQRIRVSPHRRETR